MNKNANVFLSILLVLFVAAFTLPSASAQGTTPAPSEIKSAPVVSDDFDAGMRLYRSGRYAAAIGVFERATRADPTNAAAWYFLGYAQYVTHQTAAALDSFSKAFQADPAFDPRPYFYGRK